jgi:hypothetical protein
VKRSARPTGALSTLDRRRRRRGPDPTDLIGATATGQAYGTYVHSVPSSRLSPRNPVASLTGLPAGSYVVVARAVVAQLGATTTTRDHVARCVLSAGADAGQGARVCFDRGAGSVFSLGTTIALGVVHTFDGSGRVDVICTPVSGSPALENLKVTAIQVG